MNLHSSRSHAIFTVTIECSEKGPDGKHHVRAGKLHLVDLAVSYINLTRKECDMDVNDRLIDWCLMPTLAIFHRCRNKFIIELII